MGKKLHVLLCSSCHDSFEVCGVFKHVKDAKSHANELAQQLFKERQTNPSKYSRDSTCPESYQLQWYSDDDQWRGVDDPEDTTFLEFLIQNYVLDKFYEPRVR